MTVRAVPVRRAGFTLVELLIVIAIIASLAALLLGAISRVKEVGRKTVTASEISQLETAVAKFKTDFGFAPPSYAVFPTPGIAPASGSDAEKTARYLQKMFRAYEPLNPSQVDLDPSTPGNQGFTFRGNNLSGGTLIGVQSIVWFLGGPNGTGFQPNLPSAPGANASSVKGPYYNFDPNRFINPETKSDTENLYRDPWGTPYAYFSTGSGKNYDAAYTWAVPGRASTYLGAYRVGGTTASPWAAPGQIQIISAGPDTEFGTFYSGTTRGEWVPGAGEYTDTSTTGYGADDIANFNNGAALGVAAK